MEEVTFEVWPLLTIRGGRGMFGATGRVSHKHSFGIRGHEVREKGADKWGAQKIGGRGDFRAHYCFAKDATATVMISADIANALNELH